MAYSKDKINEVRKSYVFERLSLDKCAELHKVSYPTVQRWKNQAKLNGDDWDKVRTAHTLAGGEIEDMGREILTDFVIEYKSTMTILREDESLSSAQRVAFLTSLADSFNKVVSANKKILPQVSQLAVALKTVELFGTHVKDNKPELLQEFIAMLEPFGETLQQEFG
ncbi:DUF1804 family protein [Moraxella equi]|uniref:Protein of uncharacterized function (DUF1804) n=1 Tax=Moraxella equi TaxID=60442 RepID=A0A378QS68_9GAMM|nr:DUF1804 family protein [Moraxella equi]OPH33250.1 hypothetical protein B5J93_13065 [Moraxella equi]STZ03628.1 Protein of uncharacterised function (DUF1804) [Moraxella equi]